jgi:hypothetical protein
MESTRILPRNADEFSISFVSTWLATVLVKERENTFSVHFFHSFYINSLIMIYPGY